MGCPVELYELISEGDKVAVITYMDRYKMTPQYIRDYNRKMVGGRLHRSPYYCDELEAMFAHFPVKEAASLGQLDIMNTLIERGFDPDNKDLLMHDERRPIHCACRNDHLDIVKCLIEDHNVDMNDEEGAPLLEAIEENNTEIVKYLIESGATLNDLNVLHECVRCCNPEIVKYIISKDLDVNAMDLHLTIPLLLTVNCHFSYSKALALLEAGADVDAKDEDGNTTFLRAAQKQYVDLMRLLISRGADPNVVNNNGDTALHIALYEPVNHEMIQCLVVELGLECLNTKNSQDITPFTLALKNARYKCMFELLVNYGCNFTDEFDILDDKDKEKISDKIPNCTEFFQHLKQIVSPPRSLMDLASLKIRRHLGVHLESAVNELPLPEGLKNLVRIQKTNVDV